MAAPVVFKAATATPVAPVSSIPTTAAHFAVWNSAPAGGKSLVIQTVESAVIVSTGVVVITQIFAHVSVAPVFKFSGTAAKGPQVLTGPEVNSIAQVASAVTIVNDGIWHPVSPSNNSGAATTTIAVGNFANVQGLYVIPPQGLLSLAVVSSTVSTTTCNLYVSWIEQ